MRKSALLIVLTVISAYCIFSSEAAVPIHLALGRKLEENILPQNNSYQHRPSIVRIKGIRGAENYICHTDCSGLVAALFRDAYGFSKEELHSWLRRPSGYSISFFEAVSHRRRFTQIEKVQDIVPGDILTYKLPKGARNFGHVMIANGPAKKIDSDRWAIPIIDCTGKGHGHTDSRYLENETYHSGIGKGDFCIYSDGEGTITGSAWSVSSKFHSIHSRPFLVGRFNQGE